MAAQPQRKPYFITLIQNLQKNYPDINWSTELRKKDDDWLRVVTGGKGRFAIAVEVPDKPIVINKKAFWRQVGDYVTAKIAQGEQLHHEDEKNQGNTTEKSIPDGSSETGLPRGSANPSGDDDGQVPPHSRA